MNALAALLAALVALNHAALRSFRSPYPPVTELRLGAEDAVLGAAMASFGMRRLAADIAFIRLIVYYGTSEAGGKEEGAGHEEHHHEGPGFSGGVYPELKERGLRILSMDPDFSYAVLYTAGALAFNQNRPEEALDLLGEGLRRQPRNWQYTAYVAAIGAKQRGDPKKVLENLEPVLKDPECPTMLKNMAAFVNLQLGRKDVAIRLYRDILRSRDKNYHPAARKALERLGADPNP